MYAGLNGLKGLKGVMGSERFKGLKTVLGSKRTRVLVVAAVGLVLVGVAAAVCLELPAGQALPARLRELARSWLRGLARDGPDGEQFVPTKPVPTPPPVAPSPGYRRPDLPGEGAAGLEADEGRVVVLCFVSTTSGPSVAQLPALGRLADTYPGIRVLLVAVGEKPEGLAEWLSARQVHPDVAARAVADPGGAEAQRWKVPAAPTTFVIRAADIVDWLRVGVASYDELAEAVRRADAGPEAGACD